MKYLTIIVVCALLVTCSLIPGWSGERDPFIDAARQRVSDHLWPLFVLYVEQDEDMSQEDKDRLLLGIGVLLALDGRIGVEDGATPEVVIAKARATFNKFSESELTHLTDILLDEAALKQYQANMDLITLQVLQEVTVRTN